MNKPTTNRAGHPLDPYLRAERMPHIWCSGCGLGLVVNCFLRGLIQSRLALDKVVVVSGIGCAGRAAGYINLDSFHTTHGRAIPFATGLKLANPELKVVVISGDGDLTAIGGNHLIHAARRNADLTVLCINNFIYGMTGGQGGPTTPLTARTTTSVGGNIDQPFNIPYLAAASGAAYVARWTTAQVVRLQKSITEALLKNGFGLIEIITPCPTYYGRMNKQRTGLEQMKYYRDNSIIKSGIDPKHAGIEFNGPIIVGRFVD
ncbi:MAG: thiamine pyrophosphate-dependent enzyme [Dehalococcoidales bacterium]|nr:thiamine pyrophosphate-dependent enzyme [Dehalococcoidales bacterium]